METHAHSEWGEQRWRAARYRYYSKLLGVFMLLILLLLIHPLKVPRKNRIRHPLTTMASPIT